MTYPFNYIHSYARFNNLLLAASLIPFSDILEAILAVRAVLLALSAYMRSWNTAFKLQVHNIIIIFSQIKYHPRLVDYPPNQFTVVCRWQSSKGNRNRTPNLILSSSPLANPSVIGVVQAPKAVMANTD